MVETLKPSMITSKHVKKNFFNKAKTFTKKTIASLAIAGTLLSCDVSLDYCEFSDVEKENVVEHNDFLSEKENTSKNNLYGLIKSYIKEDNHFPENEPKDYCYLGPRKNEKSMSLFNKFRFIYPDKEGYRELAEAHLIDTYFCYHRIKDTLGIDLLTIPSNIIRGSITTIGKTATASQSGTYYPHPETLSFEDKMIIANHSKWNVRNDKCYSVVAHELTHLFNFSLPHTRWLNEGISVYMEYVHGTSGYGNSPMTLERMCLEDKILLSSEGEFFNHMNLGESLNPEIHKSYYYLTAACFWHDLEKEYGENTIHTVYKEFLKYQTREPSELPNLRKLPYLRIIQDAIGPLSMELLLKYGLTDMDDNHADNPTYY
jgi:hypothetical protein